MYKEEGRELVPKFLEGGREWQGACCANILKIYNRVLYRE